MSNSFYVSFYQLKVYQFSGTFSTIIAVIRLVTLFLFLFFRASLLAVKVTAILLLNIFKSLLRLQIIASY